MLETNIVVAPVVKAVSLDWQSVITLWSPTLLLLLGGLALYLKARAAQIMNTLTAKKVEETAIKMEEVSVKVNGQHAALMAKTDAQTAEILGLSKEKATLVEQKHGAEVASALKEQSK